MVDASLAWSPHPRLDSMLNICPYKISICLSSPGVNNPQSTSVSHSVRPNLTYNQPTNQFCRAWSDLMDPLRNPGGQGAEYCGVGKQLHICGRSVTLTRRLHASISGMLLRAEPQRLLLRSSFPCSGAHPTLDMLAFQSCALGPFGFRLLD